MTIPTTSDMTGLLGFASGYRAMEHCDALLVVGTDFPYPQFYPAKAKKIQIDVRGSQIGRRTPIDIGLVGTAKETLASLKPLLKAKKSDAHLKDSLHHYQTTRKDLDELAIGKPGTSPLHPEYVVKILNEVAAENAVFTVDVGTPCIWAARYLRFNGKRSLIGSFSHGSMANALPHALGAQAVDRSRQVISLSGDGGLAMLMGELLTAVQNKLPVKIIVFNNHALSFCGGRDDVRGNRSLWHRSHQSRLQQGCRGVRLVQPASHPAGRAERRVPGPHSSMMALRFWMSMSIAANSPSHPTSHSRRQLASASTCRNV